MSELKVTGEAIGADRIEAYGKEANAYLEDPTFIANVRKHFFLHNGEIYFNKLKAGDGSPSKVRKWNKTFGGKKLYSRSFSLSYKTVSRERIEHILRTA